LESLHILNNKKPEPYWFYMHDYKHFEAPTVVIHTEGHRPPRNLSMEQLQVILRFLARQFKKRNPQADKSKVDEILKQVDAGLTESFYLK